PEFSNLKVYGGRKKGETVLLEPETPVTVRDLLRHTSGLTYGFFGQTVVDRLYAQAEVLNSNGLQDMVNKLSRIPLLCQPATKFNYSVSTDILGRIIEKVSGSRLEDFFEREIFRPLNMVDTGFSVPKAERDRFTTVYTPNPGQELMINDKFSSSKFLKPPALYSGGGGLISTARDYMRFCEMLRNGGEFQGKRIIGQKEIAAMIRNQLPASAYPISVLGKQEGVGFGLGVSVVVEKTDYTKTAQIGEYGWDGIASTHFWVSPKQNLVVVLLSQNLPFSLQLKNAIRPLIYNALNP
ncbi:MAG: serine hydrolase domain-containing protein, partial [Planctomycetota bacterium]|nr:serine hydrolase domain-containing protein [Planctomycetota bacterium]